MHSLGGKATYPREQARTIKARRRCEIHFSCWKILFSVLSPAQSETAWFPGAISPALEREVRLSFSTGPVQLRWESNTDRFARLREGRLAVPRPSWSNPPVDPGVSHPFRPRHLPQPADCLQHAGHESSLGPAAESYTSAAEPAHPHEPSPSETRSARDRRTLQSQPQAPEDLCRPKPAAAAPLPSRSPCTTSERDCPSCCPRARRPSPLLETHSTPRSWASKAPQHACPSRPCVDRAQHDPRQMLPREQRNHKPRDCPSLLHEHSGTAELGARLPPPLQEAQSHVADSAEGRTEQPLDSNSSEIPLLRGRHPDPARVSLPKNGETLAPPPRCTWKLRPA